MRINEAARAAFSKAVDQARRGDRPQQASFLPVNWTSAQIENFAKTNFRCNCEICGVLGRSCAGLSALLPAVRFVRSISLRF